MLPAPLYNGAMQTGERIGQGRTADFYAVGPWALKLLRPGYSSKEVLAEAQKSLAAARAGLPVPAVLAILEQDGRPGVLYERVNGPTMLDRILAKPWRAFVYARQLARLHVLVHSKKALELISFNQRLQHAIERNNDLAPRLQAAILSLLASLPAGDSFCHGDFHPANIIITEQQPVIIDWLDAGQGNSLADVARTQMLFTIPRLSMPAPRRFLIDLLRAGALQAYLDEYFTLLPGGKSQLNDWLTVVLAARLAEQVPGEKEVIITRLARRFK